MELISADAERSVVGLNGSSRSLFTALLNFQYPSIPILVVVPTEKEAEIFSEDLRPFLGSKTTNSAGTSTSNSNPTSLLKSKATSVGMILKPKRKSEYLFVVSMFHFS